MFTFQESQVVAVTPGERLLTGSDLARVGGAMGKLVPPRSLVFALCSNTEGSLCGYLACLQNRVVPLMLDAEMDATLLGGLIQTYGPQYIWLPNETAQQTMFDGWPLRLNAEEYGYRLLENPRPTPNLKLHPDLALLLTTSGSTGSPKLVRISYDNLLANAESIAQYLEITAEERPITTLPMHYSYGLSVINSHLLRGATLLLTPRSIMEKEFWAFFREAGATSLSGVPYTYQMLKRLRLQRMELPTLRTLTQAGGKLGAELVHEYAEWAAQSGRRFVVMYGQTEATARMSYLPAEQALTRSASIGIPIPGGSFTVVDTEGKPIQTPETPGELVYRGANVSLGYAECPADLALGDVNHGVLHTGDVAQFDADGYYYIVGRLKRFVKIFGNRVNLDQAEQIARGLVSDCACTGEDDRLVVHITDSTQQEAMRSHMAATLGLHPSAIAVDVVAEIPKNSAGKIQYAALTR